MMRLFKNHQGWMVQTDDPEVKRLFGTDVMPTAFTAQAKPERVLAEIQKLNPGEKVEILEQVIPYGDR